MNAARQTSGMMTGPRTAREVVDGAAEILRRDLLRRALVGIVEDTH